MGILKFHKSFHIQDKTEIINILIKLSGVSNYFKM